MTKILCFCFALNCFDQGWTWTGILFLWVCFFKEFKR